MHKQVIVTVVRHWRYHIGRSTISTGRLASRSARSDIRDDTFSRGIGHFVDISVKCSASELEDCRPTCVCRSLEGLSAGRGMSRGRSQVVERPGGRSNCSRVANSIGPVDQTCNLNLPSRSTSGSDHRRREQRQQLAATAAAVGSGGLPLERSLLPFHTLQPKFDTEHAIGRCSHLPSGPAENNDNNSLVMARLALRNSVSRFGTQLGSFIAKRFRIRAGRETRRANVCGQCAREQ